MNQRWSAFLDFLKWFWFPAALGLLLLLAIPGIILFAMNLFGMESKTNEWLEQNLALSYSLPVPWWAALILLLVPILILILYFLKLKRKPIQVPSTFLWKKSIEDLHVNSLLQWLRQNILLLLQILTVLVLIYALMAPRFHGQQTQGKHYIVMIDNSASMSATDIKPSRLEWAKQEAIKVIEAANDDDYGMVIVFNSTAQTLQSRTNNRDFLRRAVQSIQPTQRPSKIGDRASGFKDALDLADSLANPSRSTDDAAVRPPGEDPAKARTYVETKGTDTDVHLFSDGRFPDVPDFALGNLHLTFHSAGIRDPDQQSNVGIITLNAARDETDLRRVDVFLRVMSCRPKPIDVRVELEVTTVGKDPIYYYDKIPLPGRKKPAAEAPQPPVDGKKPDGKKPKDSPRAEPELPVEQASFALRDIDERSDTIIHARLAEFTDDFPLDDKASLVLGVVRKARILLVSKGNEILGKFFDEVLLEGVAVLQRLAPDQLDPDKNRTYDKDYLGPARNGDFDLVVFDRCRPASDDDMPRANTFFIGIPPPGWKLPGAAGDEGKPVEKVANPHVRGWMTRHVLLHWLAALHEIGIAEAFRMKDLPPRTPLLLEGENEMPLMLTLSRGAYSDLVMTFPLLNDKDEWNTNWPLKPSFPLFLRNVLYTLGNVSDAPTEESIQPGQVKTIRPDVAVKSIEVRSPGGKTFRLQQGPRPDFSFGATEAVGIYGVLWNDAVQRRFAVNLLDQDESNLEPREMIRVGAKESERGESHRQPRHLWKWIVLGALVLLLVEWYIWNRRVYI